MSRRIALIGLLVAGFGAVPSARAGLYNTADAEAETRLSPNFEGVFRSVLGDLRSVSAAKPDRESTLRKRYVLMEALGAKAIPDLRTLEEKLNYSVVLIRRNKADEAISLLQPLTREHPDNLIVQSHFATAHFLSSSEDFRARATDLMRQTLSIWPERWDDLDDARKAYLARLGWEGLYEQNRKYEVYFEKLIRHRIREEARRKKKLPIEETIDPLFVGNDQDKKPVRFVSDAGKFEAGRLADAERARLPGDAIEIVEQLLVWMPNDLRLYWLLGELLNANAMTRKTDAEKYQDIRSSYLIMKELVEGWRDAPKELGEHHAVLKNYLEMTPAPNPIAVGELKNIIDDPDKDTNPPLTAEQWWRALVVGFVTGFAIGLFALWQIQEMRRRRQARAMADRG